jgi:hypothetical protein
MLITYRWDRSVITVRMSLLVDRLSSLVLSGCMLYLLHLLATAAPTSPEVLGAGGSSEPPSLSGADAAAEAPTAGDTAASVSAAVASAAVWLGTAPWNTVSLSSSSSSFGSSLLWWLGLDEGLPGISRKIVVVGVVLELLAVCMNIDALVR